MDLTRSLLTGTIYSAYVSVKIKLESHMPIQLLHFPCIELEGMTIRLANAEACALLGENPAGRPLVALLDENARKVWRRESARRMARRIEYLGETGLICRNGRVRARLLLLRGHRRSTLVLSSTCACGQPTVMDAQHPSNTETDAVLESDALADIAHEMRTPLTIIRSAASLMRERPDASAQYLQGIERNCERLQRIVNEILALNATGGDRYEPACENVELVGWLSDLVSGMKPQAQCRGVELLLSTGLGALHMDVDTCMLEHIVINLLSNALKFTPAGGTVALRLELAGERVLLTVTDTGCGISREELRRIFERGRTGDARRGSGIGLSLASRCARALGGQLTAFSDGVSGSKFTLTLPLRQRAEAI